MAEDRNKLEQEALLLLQKEKIDDAITVYLKILKISRGDIRVRQKLADLYLSQDRKPEAVRQLREVAAGLVKEQQHRPAVVILKQLHKLNPSNVETLSSLGDCHLAVGFDAEAREAYDKALDMVEDKPKVGVVLAEKVVSLSPGEMPPKVRLAEILFRLGRKDESFSMWTGLGHEARRRGIAGDQANFYERALRIEEDDLPSLESAAEARIKMGAPKEALVHIQKAYAQDATSTRVLSMLAQCFEIMEQQPKAKKVLVQLAKLHEDRLEAVEQLEALQRALACDPDDAELKSRVGDAGVIAERVEMRLTGSEWSSPSTVEQAEVVIRAQVLAEYGFPDRAKSALADSSEDLRQTNAVKAALAEVLVQLDDIEGAVTEMNGIDENGAVAQQVQTRIGVLRGEFGEAESEGEDEEVVELEMDDDEEVVELEMDDDEEVVELEMDDDEEVVELEMDDADTDEESGSGADPGVAAAALAAAGDTEGAIEAYRQILADDPSNEGALMKLGALMAAEDGEIEDLEDDSLEDVENMGSMGGSLPSLSNIMGGGAQAPISSSADAQEDDEDLATARAYVTIGQHDQVEKVLAGRTDLPAAVLIAEVQIAAGDVKKATHTLQDAMDEVDEDAPGYTAALFGMAKCTAQLGKHKKSKRILGELEDLDPGFRSGEVAALKRALSLLAGR